MTDENEQLETFFEGEDHPISTEPEKDVETVETTQVEAESEIETETAAETTAAEKPTLVPIAALHDERRKAQQLKEENKALRNQIPEKNEAPDPYEDIDAYNAYMRKQWEDERNAATMRTRRENLDRSRSEMLEQHQDYDEMERIFELMTASDPALVEKMFASGNEAKFAYDTAKAYKESLIPVETQTEAEPLKEVPNLAKATAQASNLPQVESEATLEDIFADQEY